MMQTLKSRSRYIGFTLVEVLVVLAILTALAAVALPVARQLLADQKIDRAAADLAGFIDSARNLAIAENRPMGISIERFDPTTELGRASSVRVRMLTGVPPYRGDSTNARMQITTTGTPTETRCRFDPLTSQLLVLSAFLKYQFQQNVITLEQYQLQTPIREGDLIELPGGQRFPIRLIEPRNKGATEMLGGTTVPAGVYVNIDLRDSDVLGSGRHPLMNNGTPPVGMYSYKVHRRPSPSASRVLVMPRGIAIDLNYSGISVAGNNFAPIAGDLTRASAPDIRLLFAGDGSVSSCLESVANISGTWVPIESPPTGQLYLCVGRSEGVRPDNLFISDDDDSANLMSLDSIWVVTQPATGRTVASPTASVTVPAAAVGVTDPATALMAPALVQARFLANLSDTIEVP